MDTKIFTKEEIVTLQNGGVVDVNGKRYGLCMTCQRIIRIDGWTGTLHLCR